ncbi:MAG: MarR family transcriptional regulator [candidate division Zixibacteria bacterium]|nr:MarR family transcriptional regulator [candidate division Zixibacteria bacterium]
MIKRIEKIAGSFVRVLNRMIENHKVPRKYGLDELIYPSEIHTIMIIGGKQGLGVADLAGRLGITKGAVSQMVNRLVDKGFINKSQDPDNGKRVILELTNKGKIAYYSHEKMHEETDKELIKYLKSLKAKELSVIEKFFEHAEQGIEKRNET